MPTEFEELRIRVCKVGAGRYLVFANGPAAATTVIDLPRDKVQRFVKERDDLLDEEFRRRDPPPGVSKPVGERLQDLGEELFRILCPGPLVQCLRRSQQLAGDQGRSLRLRFFLAGDLRDLPVEILWTEEHQWGFLALNPSFTVVRSQPGGERRPGRYPTHEEKRRRLNLLVVVASPAWTPDRREPLDPLTSARAEVTQLLALVRPKVEILSGLPLGQRTAAPATETRFRQRLDALRKQDGPAAVLLIAHGWFDGDNRQGNLYLEQDDGRAAPVTGGTLAGWLAALPRLRFVALNLCRGAKAGPRDPFSGVAQALISAGIPAVAAMQYDVSDAAASRFSPILFGRLCEDEPIDEALTQGRRAMAGVEAGGDDQGLVRTQTEWCNPTLFLNDECRFTWLFKGSQVAGPDEVEPPDPLADGHAAFEQVDQGGFLPIDLHVRAARYCRIQNDWTEADRGASEGLLADDGNAVLRSLQREAQVEKLQPQVVEVCETIAKEKGLLPSQEILNVLEGVRHDNNEVPEGVFQSLVAEARESPVLFQQYQKLLSHEKAREWESARGDCSDILSRRPAGYQDVCDRVAAIRCLLEELEHLYQEALGHEQAGEWEAALRVHSAILTQSPAGYKEVCGRIAYVRGRAAEDRGDWAAAETAFAEAPESYADRGHWLAWVRGRAAGARGDWPALLRELHGIPASHPRPVQPWRTYAEARLAEVQAEQDDTWDRVVALYEALPADFEDAAPRAAHARSRAAQVRARAAHVRAHAAEQKALEAQERREQEESARRWGEAATAYAEAAAEIDDARLRLAYARGRHAEAEARWADAAAAYRETEEGYEDVRRRLPYCLGRAADRDAAWARVIDGFGELEDDYRDVRLYRGYARGRGKEQEKAWPAAVEAYRLLPPDFRGAGGRMAYCLGRSLEEAGAWPQAAAAYADAQHSYPDAPPHRAYCLGRAREAAGDWAAAAEQFQLAEGYADAPTRLAYAQVLAGEMRREWAAVQEAYQRLPGDLPADRRAVAQRCSTHAAGRLALEARQWAAAEEAFRSLPPGEADAGRFLRYVGARRAEEQGDWAGVCRALDGLPHACLDVADLSAYAAGRAAEADGRWSAALAAYRGLPSDFRSDVPGRVKRLAALLEQAPWLDGLAHAGLVAHPLAQDDAAFPYRRLAPAGITPGSSNEEIKNASFVLMAKGLMTPEVRVAWDRVRTTSKRLLVDALLYRVEEPAAVRRAQERLPPAPAAVLLRALCQECPANAPLFLLLAGQREQAVARWEEQQRQAPADAALAHRLALAHLGAAADLEARGAFERADPAWERAVAHWVVALSDDAYWAAWRQERSAAYGVAVSGNDMALLRSSLCNHVQQQLAAHADRCASEGRQERAAHFRRLGLAFEVELEGARVLKEAGGLPLPGAATGLCCGPRFLRLHGLAAALGRRAAELEARLVQSPDEEEDVVAALEKALAETAPETPAGSLTPETLGRLRCVFGRLSEAFILLGRHQPQEALQALPAEALRTTLTNLPPDCGHATAPADDCPDCRDLTREDPAYLCLPNRGLRRVQDAVKLAEDAHLALAEAALAGGAADLDEPFRHWQAAVAVAFNVRAHVRTKQEITRTVLGRATALQEEEGQQRGERLGQAIELVERARRLIGAADAEQLRAQQAELLTLRGVWFGYGCRHWEFPDYAKAAADLRRALELQPESLTARDNLARALVFEATNLRLDGKARQSWPLVAEALDVLDVGLRPLPDHVRLQKMLQQTLQELETLAGGESLAATLERLDQVLATRPTTAEAAAGRVTALVHEARAKRERGDLSGTILALAEAVRLDPEDAALRGELIATVKKKMQEK